MGHPRPLLHLFLVFFKQRMQISQQIYVKKCPSSIWYFDSNSRPSEYESPPLTTRPGLPPFVSFLAWQICFIFSRTNFLPSRFRPSRRWSTSVLPWTLRWSSKSEPEIYRLATRPKNRPNSSSNCTERSPSFSRRQLWHRSGKFKSKQQISVCPVTSYFGQFARCWLF